MLFERYRELEVCRKDIENALELMIDTYKKGGKILICGNGGSASDSEHIVGELLKGFMLKRPVTESRSIYGKGFKDRCLPFPCQVSVLFYQRLSMMWNRK